MGMILSPLRPPRGEWDLYPTPRGGVKQSRAEVLVAMCQR